MLARPGQLLCKCNEFSYGLLADVVLTNIRGGFCSHHLLTILQKSDDFRAFWSHSDLRSDRLVGDVIAPDLTDKLSDGGLFRANNCDFPRVRQQEINRSECVPESGRVLSSRISDLPQH